jgi:glycosyltransferase involved in cell wall biosynthesis
MKIIQIASGIYPIPSDNRAAAIEKIIYELSLNLSLKGCDVHIIDIPSKKRVKSTIQFHETSNLNCLNIRLNSTQRSILFSFFSAFMLLKVLRKIQADVVHTHYSYSGFLCMIVCRLFTNIHNIHTTHAHDLIMYSSPLNIVKGFSEIITLKYSNHIIAETSTVKEQLIYRFHVPSQKISVISSGVDIPVISQKEHNHSDYIILSVGRICSRKNQMALVNAIPDVLVFHPRVKFIFVGPIEDNSYFQKIIEVIKLKNISKNVKFTGEIPREQLNEMYNDATIFVFPTIAEIQGLVVLEAMSHGLPVIASKIGPIIDIVTKIPESALLVYPDPKNLASAINKLLDDNSLRSKHSEEAKKLASNFAWKDVSNRVLAMYEKINEFNYN